ncbi:MAG: squalene synthase HpnC [Gemmatimonadota bacterium]
MSADNALPAADAVCAALARTHYENFPLPAPLLPRAERRDLAAIYAFCRTTDDLGDEWPGDRLAALDAWETSLRVAFADARQAVTARFAAVAAPRDPVVDALARTVRRRGLPGTLFWRLIEANRRDQTTFRYRDTAELLDYCEHSATPVGRMVLGVAGRATPALGAMADATCIGLQLANFWQDLRRDWAQDRCYLPLDACARHGVDPMVELGRATASPALQALLAEQVGAARDWLRRGWPLSAHLSWRWRPLVRGFTRGGWAICDAIAAQGFDTLRARPEVSRRARRAIARAEIIRGWRRQAPLPE